ncbi:MAG: hypothetical protein AB7O24_15475 [Kofleriaceae bacterium]
MRFGLTTLLFASAISLGGLSAPAVAAPGHTAASPTAVTEHASTPTRAVAAAETPSSDAEHYEQREKDSAKAGEFKGGNVVIILSGTGLVIALLVLLLIT